MIQHKAKHDVFLSYNNRDREQVENIANRLREQGLSVFLDRWYLVPGIPWPQHLEEILTDCRAVAVFLGPHGMGRWQQREQYLALDHQSQDPNFPVIPVLLPGADPPLGFLSLNTWVDCRETIVSDQSLTVLAAAIRGQSPGPDLQRHNATALSNICPYRGLLFFREEDAPFFFGRDAFIERLVTAVQKHTLVAVVGASGSGKSSVVRAGLVPRLRRKANNQVWDVITIVPGNRPLQNLAAAMVRLLEPEMTEVDRLREITKLADSLLAGQIRLIDVVTTALEKQPGTDRLMLVVDQFEELYSLTRDESVRQKFVGELIDATTSSSLSVVLTLRGDFFDEVVSERRFSDRLQDATVHVSRMNREELNQAIENPARKVGLQLEPGLASRILDKLQDQPGNLPLLEFVLTELWKERQDAWLTHSAYERMGEAEGAIATQAETAFEAFSPADQEIARRVFLQLVGPGSDINSPTLEAEPTRRRTTFAELGKAAEPVVRKLADAHLLVTGRNEATGEEIVDLVHEALIKAWKRLRDWIKEDLAFLQWREQMRTFVNVAEAKKYQRNTLLRGSLLTEAKAWSRDRRLDLSVSEQRYIDASVKATNIRLASISLILLALIAAAGFSYYRITRLPLTSGVIPTSSPTSSTVESFIPSPSPTPTVQNTAAADTIKKWPAGKVLRVRFMGGSQFVQEKVKLYANEWSKYANIHFEFISKGEAEIRISFKDNESWSYVGTDALDVPSDKPTMNLALAGPSASDAEYSSIVLREFGHVLGLINEHQNPNAQIPWDKGNVYRHYSYWTKEQVDSQVFEKVNLKDYRPFDPKSVMMFAFPRKLFTTNFETGINRELSDSDKSFIAKLYPK